MASKLRTIREKVGELELSRAVPESLLYVPLLPLFVVFYLYDKVMERLKERRQNGE